VNRVGVIGLGVMGGRIARRFLAPDIALTVYDTDPAAVARLAEAGAHAAGSPAEVAADSDLVLTSVPTGDHLMQVLDGPAGVLAAGRAGLDVVDLSTIGVVAAERAAVLVHGRGGCFLDAACAQGHLHAENGTLTLLVGGDAAALDRVRPLLARMSGAVFHFGPSGSGQAAKLAYNLSGVAAVAAAAEGVKLLQALGGDLATFVAMLETVDANFFWRRPAIDTLAGRYEAGFKVDLALKDLELVLAAARDSGVRLRVGAAAGELLRAASEAGFGDKHTSAMSAVRP
jgi:3-hydroxyisobutyrate dehydrogenase-like beta-hydroxyacid dehydrogenase